MMEAPRYRWRRPGIDDVGVMLLVVLELVLMIACLKVISLPYPGLWFRISGGMVFPSSHFFPASHLVVAVGGLGRSCSCYRAGIPLDWTNMAGS